MENPAPETSAAYEQSPRKIRYTIKDLPRHERPRERLRDHGPTSLSNPELIAIILRTGTADNTAVELATNLLARFGSIKNIGCLTVKELTQVHGIGEAKAAQILAALELGKRAATYRDGARPRISSPADAANLFSAEMHPLKKEILKLIMLNTKNEVIKTLQISEGTLNSAELHPRETFREAIREAAAAIILIHNHPSGDPEPSRDDIKVTNDFEHAAALLGVDLLDHIIIGAGGTFSSLREKGHFKKPRP